MRRIFSSPALAAILAFATFLAASGPALATSTDPKIARLAAEAERYLRAAERRPEGPEQLELYARAEGLAERALETSPDSAKAHFVYFAARGRRLLAEGGVSSALKMTSLNKHLARALELDPDYANALAAKGGILLDLPFYLGGDAAQAEHYLRRAVALNPTGPGTRITYAKALLRQGRRDEARENLRLAAHYACVTRRASVLTKATELLADLEN